jgi:hypothetical protein
MTLSRGTGISGRFSPADVPRTWRPWTGTSLRGYSLSSTYRRRSRTFGRSISMLESKGAITPLQREIILSFRELPDAEWFYLAGTALSSISRGG